MCVKIYMTDKRRQKNDNDNVRRSNIIIRKRKKLNERKPQ